jgi:hypothetical protein
MLRTPVIADWLTAQTTDAKLPFFPGPEMKQFGNSDLGIGSVTKVPGGIGITEDGAFEEQAVQLVIEGRSKVGTGRLSYDALEAAVDRIDKVFQSSGSEMIWGTYILYRIRLGSFDPAFIADERVQFIGIYQISEGLAP